MLKDNLADFQMMSSGKCKFCNKRERELKAAVWAKDE